MLNLCLTADAQPEGATPRCRIVRGTRPRAACGGGLCLRLGSMNSGADVGGGITNFNKVRFKVRPDGWRFPKRSATLHQGLE